MNTMPLTLTTDPHSKIAGDVGIDPIASVTRMENHDGAYHTWRHAGMRNRILLHCDAHIDFDLFLNAEPEALLHARSLSTLEAQLHAQPLWNVTKRTFDEQLNIGNFIYPAMQQGVVRAFYWVLPDAMCATSADHARIAKELAAFAKSCPHRFAPVTMQDGLISTACDGQPIVAGRLHDMPRWDEPVLLDLDTDYLIVQDAGRTFPHYDPASHTPWLWPAACLDRLRAHGVRTDCVTIAYSVEGGFTPQGYKWLGDELADRLQQVRLSEEAQLCYARRQRVCVAHDTQGLSVARQICETALTEAPTDPVLTFRYAHILYALGEREQARAVYADTLQRDQSVDTPYNNPGSVYEEIGPSSAVEEAYRQQVDLHPEGAHAWVGLGDYYRVQSRWDDALVAYDAADARQSAVPSTIYGRAVIAEQRRAWQTVIALCEPLVTQGEHRMSALRLLSTAYLRTRQWSQARDALWEFYRYHGRGNAQLFVELAHVYWRLGLYGKSWQSCLRACHMLPAEYRRWRKRQRLRGAG
jgi:tetratricopeptide (TPR) repeat protein